MGRIFLSLSNGVPLPFKLTRSSYAPIYSSSIIFEKIAFLSYATDGYPPMLIWIPSRVYIPPAIWPAIATFYNMMRIEGLANTARQHPRL